MSSKTEIETYPTPTQPKFESSFGLIEKYFVFLRRILLHPKAFFSTMPIEGGLSGPLAFALVTHWLGSSVQYLWHMLLGGMIGNLFAPLMKLAGTSGDIDSPGRAAQILDLQQRFLQWFWGVGSIIADPFINLVTLFSTSILVFMGAKILIPSPSVKPVTFEAILRILCFALAPSVFAGIPLMGSVISWTCVLIYSIVGIKEVYQTTAGRSAAIALFPKILILSLFMGIFAILLIGFFKLFASAFG